VYTGDAFASPAGTTFAAFCVVFWRAGPREERFTLDLAGGLAARSARKCRCTCCGRFYLSGRALGRLPLLPRLFLTLPCRDPEIALRHCVVREIRWRFAIGPKA
jgi:hypothetical protein